MVRIVCITGIDGTGKTSHAKSICKRLESQGLVAEYVYGRLSPGILTKALFLVGRDFSRRKGFTKGHNPAHRLSSPVRVVTVAGVVALMFIEYIPSLRRKISSTAKHTELMIFDRYVFDTTVSDIGSVFDLNSSRIFQITKLFQAFAPRPIMTILLDLTPLEAATRKPDESTDYLEFCRGRYTELATVNGWTKVSSSESFDVVDDAIMAIIQKRLGNQRQRGS